MPRKSAKRFKVNKRKKEKNKEEGLLKSIVIPIAATVIVFSIGFTLYTVRTAAQPPTEKDLNACRADSDCVQVPTDCCGCENGGESKAVSKNFRGYFAEERARKCNNVACLTVYVCEEDVKPRCVQGQCTLRAEQPPQ